MSYEANAAPVAGGAAAVGIGFWLLRGGAIAGLLGTGAATMYYKGKAEAVSGKADSAALELERQKVELAQEQARLAETQRQSAELARERAELAHGHESGLDSTYLLVAGLAALATLAVWYGLNQRAKARRVGAY